LMESERVINPILHDSKLFGPSSNIRKNPAKI